MAQIQYDDVKATQKRLEQEGKKAKDLAAAIEKVRVQTDNERKAYCVEFRKSLKEYMSHKGLYTPGFTNIMNKYLEKLDALHQDYMHAINHMERVSISAL